MIAPSFLKRPLTKWLLLVGACAAVFFSHSSTAIAPIPEPSINELAMERYQVATKGYELATNGRPVTEEPGIEAIDWMRRRVKARLDIVEPKNGRVEFLREYLEVVKREEAFQERMVKKRLGGVQALLRAQYDRIEAEMLLKQAEAK